MSNTLNSTLKPVTAPINPVAIFADSELNGCRCVDFMGSQYYLKPQAFNVLTGDEDPSKPNFVTRARLILKTSIWLLQKPQFLDIAAVFGYVNRFYSPYHSDPTFWDAPEFTESADRAMGYYTREGFDSAQFQIDNLTDERIIRGLQLYLGEGKTERPHVLRMCLFNLMTRHTLYVYESDPVSLYNPPPFYRFDGVIYQLRQQSYCNDATYCWYYPQGSLFDV